MEIFTSLLLFSLPWLGLSSYLDNSTLQLLINTQLTDSGNIKYYHTLTTLHSPLALTAIR